MADTRPGDGRLPAYWKTGPGALKIRWGTPGDFTRCTRELLKHLGPGRTERACAQWHFDVTGQYPGAVKGKNPNGPG